MRYLIKNGRVVDPANGIDDIMDILIADGKIAEVGKNITAGADETIDATGKIVTPGLVDMHSHLREPGREDKETVLTGTIAALGGGYTSIACMPNTEPAIDNAKMVKAVKDIIKKEAATNVFIIGAITEERRGTQLTDFMAMKKEGAIAFSDDGSSVEDERILLEALKAAKKEGAFIIEHCEDAKISANGVINEGFMATKMGLRGIPKRSEYERVKRDIELAKKASARIHIAHVSCKESVEAIRKAKKEGIGVSAETCPHYFTLTEECCAAYDTNTKMSPPLRAREDVEAIKEGLRDGTIDVIATDHAPHTDSEKDVEFDFAPFGIIGLETALSISAMELVEKGVLSWKDLISKMSHAPARILNIDRGDIKKGKAADIAVIDPSKIYVYKKETVRSKSKNSPFIGWSLGTKVTEMFVSGEHVMKEGVIRPGSPTRSR